MNYIDVEFVSVTYHSACYSEDEDTALEGKEEEEKEEEKEEVRTCVVNSLR